MERAIWIVDGNNMIRRDSTLAETLSRSGWEGACRMLESELAQFRRRRGRGHSVVLIFDGVASPGERDRSTKGFRIVQAGADADRRVLDEARRHEGRTEVHVVTSDRADIGSRLRGLKVRWHSVEQFVSEELRRVRRPSRTRGAAEVPDDDEKPRPPKGAEVDRWMAIFGEDPEEESD